MFDCERDHLVARVEQSFHLRAVVLEGFVDLSHVAADAIVAAVDVVDSNPICGRVRVQLNLLVESVEQRWVVLEPALVHSADGFDVLLRHRLLPQPHGFEGLLRTVVYLPPPDFPVSHARDLGEGVRTNLGSAGYALATDACHDDDIVPGVDQLFHFQTEALEVVGPCRPEGADSVAAEVTVLIRYDVRGSPFDVLVHVLERRIPVAGVERFDTPPHQVDVLLGHRPPSIPPWESDSGEAPIARVSVQECCPNSVSWRSSVAAFA